MEKSNFFLHRVCISVGCNRIFSKDLKLPINSYFCGPDWVILSWLKKKIKKNKEELKFFFFRRRIFISIGCKRIFLKELKLSINSYFFPPDRVILSRLKKNKEK